MPLSRRLAELHGGSLSIESEVGRGTTVTVLFPRERLVTAPADIASQSICPAPAEAAAATRAS